MNIIKFLRLSVLSLFIIVLFTSWQAAAEKPNYNIDISLFPEGYAKFKIDVDNYNLGDVIILPILKCEDNFTNISDLRRKLKVTDIPDMQTYEGLIDLKNSCMGVGITRPQSTSKNSTISFTYQNFDWKWHPENYPLDSYEMPILISFPEIKTDDSIMVAIRITLPQNMVITNSSAYLLWEHPANKQGEWNKDHFIQDKQGNQQIIDFEKIIYFKNNPTPAIYIPLEFERKDNFLQYTFYIIVGFLIVILILIFVLIFKKGSTDLGILTVATLIFSSYQLLSHDKPAGVTTTLDKLFLTFIGLSLLLFILHAISKFVDLQTIIPKLREKSRATAETKVKRGEKSWSFIYLVLVFIWIIIISLITIIPTDWLYKIIIILIVTPILAWLCLLNPWFQNKILPSELIKIEHDRKGEEKDFEEKMSKEKNYDENMRSFIEQSRIFAQNSLTLAGFSLTTFIFIVTIFSSFPPKGFNIEFLDYISAIFVISALIFVASTGFHAIAAWPRTSKNENRILFFHIGDVANTFGCFLYAVGIMFLLYSLSLKFSFYAFLGTFFFLYSIWVYYAYIKGT